jgi:hypothetical protein
MLNWLRPATAAIVFAAATISLTGCGDKTEKKTDESKQTSPSNGDSKIEKALAELSEADRAAATAQRICPVSDEELGSMGKPPKVTIDGQDVFICCPGCEDKLRENPEMYLAKLKKKES